MEFGRRVMALGEENHYKTLSFVEAVLLIFAMEIVIIRGLPSNSFISCFRALIVCAFLGWVFFYSKCTIKKSADNGLFYYGYVACLFFCCISGIFCFMRPNISWDTWNMFDASRHTFTDFGYMSLIRQHISNTHYEIAFPPLFFFLMAVVNKVCDLGVMSSVYIGMISTLLLISVLCRISKVTKTGFETILCTILFICGSLYMKILAGGLSQTTGFLLIAVLCYVIASETDYNIVFSIKCALITGIGAMNRFDFLAVSVAMAVIIPVLTITHGDKKKALLHSCVYIGLFLLICTPWMIYSSIHFHTIWITDNGRRLFGIPDIRPTTFFSSTSPAMTIRDDFYEWAKAIAYRGGIALKACKSVLANNTLLAESFGVAGIGVIYFWDSGVWRTVKNNINHIIRDQRNSIAITAVVISQESLIILTGYDDARYHLPFVALVQLAVLVICKKTWCVLFTRRLHNRNLETIAFIALIIVCYTKVGYSRQYKSDISYFIQNDGYRKLLTLNSDELQIQKYLSSDCECVCFFRGENKFSFLKFSALSNISSTVTPSNLSQDNVEEFANSFDVNYLYSSNHDVERIFEDKFELLETPFDNLYKVEKKREEQGR